MPQLLDPNFHRAVILLVHHDDDGAFGLVINREAEIEFRELCKALNIQWHGAQDKHVLWGGPVQPNTGWLIFRGGDSQQLAEAKDLSEGIQFASSLEVLRTVASHPPEQIRFILGYAGWGPGQLEVELSQGAWLALPIDETTVFNTPFEQMWDQVVRSLGIDPATLVATGGVH